MKGLPPALTKNIKGVPVYVWIGMLMIAIGIALYIRKQRQIAAQADVTEEEEEFYDDGGGYMPAMPSNQNGEIGAADLASITDGLQGLSADILSGFADIGGQLSSAEASIIADAQGEHAEIIDEIRSEGNPPPPTTPPAGGTTGIKKCPAGYHNVNGKCVPIKMENAPKGHGCPPGFHWDKKSKTCKPNRFNLSADTKPKREALTGGGPPVSDVARIDVARIIASIPPPPYTTSRDTKHYLPGYEPRTELEPTPGRPKPPKRR